MQDEDVAICCKMLSSLTPITVAALLSHWEVVKALVEVGAEAHAFDDGGYSALFVAAHDYPEGLLECFLSRKDTCRRIDTVNKYGLTPLMVASAAAVPLLVKAGAAVNLVHGETGTALLQASHGGFLEKVKALLEVGADERSAGRDGWTPLIWAVRKGHLHVVAYLLDRPGTDIETQTAEGLKALDVACNSGHLEVAKLLVRAGARVNPQTSNQYGALAEAAYGGHLQVVKYLVEEAGADARRAGPDGRTPLIWAAEMGHADIVAYLLGMPGIDIEAQTDKAARALDYACCNGHLEVVKLLVRAGAKVNAQASNKSPPGALASAARGGHLHVVKYLVEEAGADERHAGSGGWTPLLWAAEKGHPDIVAYLLGRPGISIHAKTKKGSRALDLACRSGHLEVVKLLVGAGVRGESHLNEALAEAASEGHLPVVRYLVEEAGADERRADEDGMAPLMVAAEMGHDDVVAYLRSIASRRDREVNGLSCCRYILGLSRVFPPS
jgi:ankyrin repeat protein